MSATASAVTEDLKEGKGEDATQRVEKKRRGKDKEKNEGSSLGKVRGMKGKIRKKLRPLFQAVGRIGAKVDQNEKKLKANEDELVKFATGVNEGMAELKKATAEQGGVMKEIHKKLEGAQERGAEKKEVIEESREGQPSRWRRFKDKVRSLWRGTKKGGEKVGSGVAAVGNGVGGAFRETGHQIAEAVRGVDDVLRDTTKLVVGKGAGNVMKYGSYLALGAPAWMPKVWNFLTGKDGSGKKIEKKSFGRKLAIAAGWTTAGAALLASWWNLVWIGGFTGSWALNKVGQKFVQDADKPEGFKITSRILGGVGAVGAYGAVGGGGTFALGALGAGLLGRLYRWARGGGSSRNKEQSSSRPPTKDEPVPESEVAAPPEVKRILDEMEAKREEQAKDHQEGHEKDAQTKDDHSDSEQTEAKPTPPPAQGNPEQAVQAVQEGAAQAKGEVKPQLPGAH